MISLDDLESQIANCLLKDRFRFRRQLRQLRQKKKKDDKRGDRLNALAAKIKRSSDARQVRSDRLPEISLNSELPIFQHSEEIISAIQQRQVVVVAGQTGSGKSTQLPQLCIQAGYGVSAMIGHTQPRRIAARTVAARIAEEMKSSIGNEVGFKIRFTDKSDEKTYIKLMTDGILLAETQGDRFLEQYEVIILDEAHERSLNIDFLIGYLHGLIQKRRDLRVIITSATLDAERFANHFADDRGPAPIIEVSGRTFPVEVRYRPSITDDAEDEIDVNEQIVNAVHELAKTDREDILVFLPTERDIREAAKRLRSEFARSSTTDVLPLYARLSTAEQNRIFQTSKHRRIVLATNVAESSLTVPGIRNVIDTGTVRISRYSPRLKVQRLPIEAVSKASADQRKGRCGRVAPGICIRLYAEDDFENREAYTTPEIRRTNLAAVILQAKALRLAPVEKLPFLDPPRADAIRDGYKTLFELGAIDDRRELTEVGRQLARMPVDPRIARMILAGHFEGCLKEILIIASALEIQDPRERPYDKQQAADEKHERFANRESDFLSYLEIWDFYHKLKEDLSRNRLKKACHQNFLSHNRLREWQEIHRQLVELSRQLGFRKSSKKDDFAAIHRALLTGLLSGVALRTAEHEYTGPGGVKFYLWPGSGLFEKRPQWIIAAELVETAKRYGRTTARISPTWIEPIADHIVKRSYSDPHWHVKSESVMAFERVNLFGLPVVQKRRVRYGKNDQAVARQIFIQHGLVEDKIRSSFPFLTHNKKVLEEVAQLAAKTRRRDLMVDEYTLYALYDRRVPSDVFDVYGLRRWLKKDARKRNKQLQFEQEDFATASSIDYMVQFPDTLMVGSIEAPVEYQFEPGNQADGVTITVPIEGVGQLGAIQNGWLVPGLVEEKVLALIRSLPKPIRRNLVPAPDTARQVVSSMEYGKGDFTQTVADHLSRIADERVTVADFRLEQIPEHLKLNVRVVDVDGEVQAESRDIKELRSEIHTETVAEVPEVSHDEWFRDGVVDWDFDELPNRIEIDRGGIAVPMFPSIVDAGESVQLRLIATQEKSEEVTKRGVMRLLTLAKKKSLKSQTRWLPDWNQTKIYAAAIIESSSLERSVQDLIALTALQVHKKLPTNRAEYEQLLEKSTELIAVAAQEVAAILPKIFSGYQSVRLALENLRSAKYREIKIDIDQQLSYLFSDDFLVGAPFQWLQQYPRYLEAIVYRLDKLTSGGETRDRQGTEIAQEYWGQFIKRHTENVEQGIVERELVEYRWMIEEFRVSHFAQPLGTFVKVSPQRMEKQWKKIVG